MSKVTTYRALRYAEATRFKPSQRVGLGDLDQTRARGPVPPQNPSRLEMVLGPQAPLDQSEDCLVLSISTPALDGSRPVLVWLHGGANVSGGGELPWYDGNLLAEEQDVVVVVVTARLGLLGFLQLEGSDGPSLATADQLNAVQWVIENISRFGGNPVNVTIGGQSAGASAVEAMLRWGVPSGVRGAIVQSGYRLCETTTAAEAARRTQDFLDFADCDPLELSTAGLLDLQRRFAQVSPAIWTPVKPDVDSPITTAVIAGWTRDDGLPFAMLAEGVSDPAARAQRSVAVASHAITEEWFVRGSQRLVAEARAAGHGGWLYEFSHEEPTSGWGTPHCAELPYVLGDEEAWRNAPMLRGANWDELRLRGRELRREWANFMYHQDPGDLWTSTPATFGFVDRRYFEQPGTSTAVS